MNRTNFLSVALASSAAACGTLQSTDTTFEKTKDLKPPVEVSRPMRERLAEFGSMVRAYAGDVEDLTIEVDLMPNDAGIDKELPRDLGNYAQAVLADIGRPFRVVRRLPSTTILSTNASGAYNDVNRAPFHRKLQGVLLRYTPERAVKLREGRADAMGTMSGKDYSAGGQADDRQTVSSLRVQLSLAGPDGVSQPGDTATYEIKVERNEERCAFSFYLAGSGFGLGGGMIATQDVGDALYDATGACLLHLLGTSFDLPYYRCDTALFTTNPQIEQRLRGKLDRMTESELDTDLKYYLFRAGHDDVDLDSYTTSAAERAIAAEEMRRRGVADAGRNSKVELIVDIWRTTDYRDASRRNDERLARRFRDASERREKAARQAAEAKPEQADPVGPKPPYVPFNFNWPDYEPVFELDLARVDANDLPVFLSAVQKCDGCEEIRTRGEDHLYGVLFRGRASDLQRALRRSAGLERYDLVWPDSSWRRLVAVPRR